jgi:hypothetical protein
MAVGIEGLRLRIPNELADRIRAAYADPCRSRLERFVLEWNYGSLLDVNEYRQQLWKTIQLADWQNLSILALAYPDEVQAHTLFHTTWLKQKLRDEGLLIC